LPAAGRSNPAGARALTATYTPAVIQRNSQKSPATRAASGLAGMQDVLDHFGLLA
jgi:hypothetical protein